MTSLFLSSGDLIADRRYQFARDLAARGDLAAAADLYAQAAEVAPGFASAWFALGEARADLGERDAAVAAFEQARAADPEDRHGAVLRLVQLGAADAAMPPGYVRAVFDQYAARFDSALAELHYRGPALLLEAVRATSVPMTFGTMLDLGCGTGLAAAAFRPHVATMAGVDLSPAMVQEARGKGLYDRLAVGDVTPFMEAEPGGTAHLVVAADVFVYLGDLAPVMAAAARVLAPEGLLAFTVETHDGPGIVLGEKLRYAHSAAYLRQVLAAAGLAPLTLESASTRDEGGVPVPGLVVVAKPR